MFTHKSSEKGKTILPFAHSSILTFSLQDQFLVQKPQTTVRFKILDDKYTALENSPKKIQKLCFYNLTETQN